MSTFGTSTAAPGRRPRGRPGHDREAVLRTAIDLFIRRGFDATSISDLAAELGVTKSAVYHHFASKEALLSAALDEALEGLSSAVEAAATATDGERSSVRLRTTVEAAVRILAGNLPAVTLLLRVRGNSDVERAAMERRRHIDERLAALVRQAAADGDLRGDVDPDIVSRLIFGMVNSLADWYRPDGPVREDALAATISSVLFEGLRPSPTGPVLA
ncbi:transcriptional regulator, TetR family [Promicromonospora umidemergens]|uniref:TetR/AcrR family transcriptional regulator n=1 Tax=Promicromonospora umidemergens TaxID=629679 RepID=A0ABP8WZ09_9MICO|nr:TetR/AcrR family transcriptional regulator [Promicromonospora umidemergens]MCP2285456.1 transcriptional regulator, TetR family [Promicromonospora umidemergens]